jgi:hypothetical protein
MCTPTRKPFPKATVARFRKRGFRLLNLLEVEVKKDVLSPDFRGLGRSYAAVTPARNRKVETIVRAIVDLDNAPTCNSRRRPANTRAQRNAPRTHQIPVRTTAAWVGDAATASRLGSNDVGAVLAHDTAEFSPTNCGSDFPISSMHL